MPNPLQRTYRLDTEKLTALVVEREITQEQLAIDAEISTVTLSGIMNGRPAYRKTIVKIANALGVKDISTLMITDPPKAILREETEDVEFYTGTSDDEEAILSKIRQAARLKKRLVMYISPSIIAMLCCLSGLAPIDARYLFIVGSVFAVLGIVLAFQKRTPIPLPMKLLLALPLAAIVLNVTAYVAWPHAFGIFPVKGGFTFGFGERQPGWLSTKPTRRFYPVLFNPPLKVNELAEISTDPKAIQWGSIRGDESGISFLCYVEFETGWNTVVMRRRGVTKQILFYISPDNKLYLKDKNGVFVHDNPHINYYPDANNFPITIVFGDEYGQLFRDYPRFLPLSQDGKTNVFIRFFRDNAAVEPENTTLRINSTLLLDGRTRAFRTNFGWNWITLRDTSGNESSLMLWVDDIDRKEIELLWKQFLINNK